MDKYEYTIKFYDYWQTGSGLSAGSKADSTTVKTKKDGLPFVSGKGIKGLLSELFEEGKEKCFGKAGIGESVKSIFSDATLVEANDIVKYGLVKELYDYISTTKLENNIAKTNSLRTKEVTIPLALKGEIEIDTECKEKIADAMKQVKRLGSGRNRGFGRCSIVLGGKIEKQEYTVTKIGNETNKTLKCTFESDVVLLGSSNTEGRSKVLDFVPGSAFLGMIAKGINDGDLSNISFEVLLNGDICFSDATLFSKDSLAYSMPSTFFKPKIVQDNDDESSKIYNFPYITNDEHKKYQMKQQRSGYITECGDILSVEYDYQQKSKHNSKERRSEKSGMYGYPSIIAGTEFIFDIKSDIHLEEIVNYLLLGTHRLGKSKSAQYGKVRFEICDSINETKFEVPENGNLTFIYAKSRLALYNKETGQATYEPTIKNLGLTSGEIDWENTQIRINSFSPYNGAQRTTTYERLVIEKGSVIAIKNLEGLLENVMQVGAYLNEGFGEVLVNPSFLAKKYFEASEEQFNDNRDEQTYPLYIGDDPLLSFLKQRKEKRDIAFKITKWVNDLESKFKGISNSQWGSIRAMAAKPMQNNIEEEEIKTYISNGKSKDMWAKGDKKGILLGAISSKEKELQIKFVKYLAMRMQSIGGKS